MNLIVMRGGSAKNISIWEMSPVDWFSFRSQHYRPFKKWLAAERRAGNGKERSMCMMQSFNDSSLQYSTLVFTIRVESEFDEVHARFMQEIELFRNPQKAQEGAENKAGNAAESIPTMKVREPPFVLIVQTRMLTYIAQDLSNSINSLSAMVKDLAEDVAALKADRDTDSGSIFDRPVLGGSILGGSILGKRHWSKALESADEVRDTLIFRPSTRTFSSQGTLKRET